MNKFYYKKLKLTDDYDYESEKEEKQTDKKSDKKEEPKKATKSHVKESNEFNEEEMGIIRKYFKNFLTFKCYLQC